ncbi:MAG: hypothetical protein ACRD2W_04425 [Acidimicrobiales bacterium]
MTAAGNRTPSAPARADTFARARKVADAVLYEGYVLYPYRASSRKNQVRWQFGVVAPRGYAETDSGEDWSMQTEILVEAGPNATLDVRLRFLRVQQRQVQAGPSFEPVADLEVDGRLLTSWDEAVEEEVNLTRVDLASLLMGERVVPLGYSASEEVEEVAGGRVVRSMRALVATMRIGAQVVPGDHPALRLQVRIENETPWGRGGVPATRDEVCRHSLAAVHTLLAVEGGAFISLADPPAWAQAAAKACVNRHTWPALVGDEGQRDVVLSSPVTLSDYPEVAPESPGDMFDATEIDEILALRVMTLTEEEKREARSTDPRAAAIIDRCDVMPEEIFERLHGAVRYLGKARGAPEAPAHDLPPVAGLLPNADTWLDGGDAAPTPWWTPEAEAEVDPFGDMVWVNGVAVARGTPVRLRPSRRADAHDLFLDGMAATVQAVFQDVDGNTQVAVSIVGDDGAEVQLGHGRYLFFYPDEVEP